MNKKEILSVLLFIVIMLSLSFASAEITERGSYWNKIDNNDGTYTLKIYNSIINYHNGSRYVPISYGSCGSYCFRDWNGLIYRVSNDTKRAYVELYTPDDNYISSFGFGITGSVGGSNYKYSTLNFTWTWWSEYNETTNEYIFRAWNNRVDFNWTQEYHFYLNQSMKIKNTIKNDLGVTIQNAKFWYIQTVGEEDGIWFNGTRHTEDTYRTGEFDSLLPQVRFEDNYVFEYDDLLENGFNITDFYLGNGSVIGISSIRIIAIGITKNPGFIPDGFSVVVDPTITISGDGADAYVASGGDANKNFGTSELLKTGSVARSYLMFNISVIPSNQKVDNASLCLYVTNTKKTQLINISHVYVGFDESTITWNNQPCGTDFDNNTNCNLTAESSVQMNSSFEYTWKCWDVANMVGREYDSGNKNASMVLYTSDSDINVFYSKEYSDSGLWPYLNITYSLADIVAPSFSNYTESPVNGSAYVSENFYEFNVTLTEENLEEVGIEFAGVNYTDVSNISNVFSFNRTDLAAGTYSYYWWANDTIGNYNTSEIRIYTVAKATPTVTLLLNGQQDNITLTYLENLNASASTSGGTVYLYRDNVNKDSENNNNVILGSAYYEYKANVTGNQNYTDNEGIILYANVTRADPTSNMQVQITPSANVNYGTQTSASGTETNTGDNDLVYSFFRNNQSSANPNTETINRGVYVYEYNTTGGQNYTSGSITNTLTVNKIGNSVSLLLNGDVDNLTITYGDNLNASGSSTSGVVSLFRDSVDVSSENSQNVVLGVGYYEYFTNSSGNVNYLANSTGEVLYVNVTQTSQTASLSFNPVSPITYGNTVSVSCNGELFRDDVNVTSEINQAVVLGAGSYGYSCRLYENQNYTYDDNNQSFVVNKAVPILTFLANSGTENLSLDYLQNVNISVSSDAGEVFLDRNNLDVSGENSLGVILGAGSYTYRANVTGNQNYSDVDYSYYSVIVGRISSLVYTYLNNSRENITINIGDSIWLNSSLEIGEENVDLYINGSLINSGIITSNYSEFNNIGLFNITTIYEETQNYTSSFEVFWISVIDVNGPEINIIEPEAKTYGYNESLPLNFSVFDLSGVSVCWYNLDGENISITNCENTTFDVSGDGSYTLILYANDSLGILGEENVSFSVSTTLAISLESPISGTWLKSGNVEFNYTISSVSGVSYCELWSDNGGWHAEQENSSIVNVSGGVNSFNLSLGDGAYIWNVFCSNTYDSFALNNYSLNIDTQNPELNVLFPVNNSAFIQNVSVNLNFSVFDENLESCWYNLDGENISITNCENLSFGFLNGSYDLAVYANDSAGNVQEFIVYNLTLNYDSIFPNLTLTEPSGSKTSQSNIPLVFSVSDIDEIECWYNLKWWDGNVWALYRENTSINCLSTSFNVANDYSYLINLYVRDRTGNLNFANSSFSVSTPSTPPTPPSSGGGGGGGGSYIRRNKTILEISSIGSVVMKPGETKTLSLSVRNKGDVQNNCKILGGGEFGSWINSEDIRNLNKEEKADFVFVLSVPKNVESKDYSMEINLVCQDTNQSTIFKVSVIKKDLEVEIKEISDVSRDKISMIYILKELSGEQQEVDVIISLLDLDGNIVESKEESVLLKSREEKEISFDLDLPSIDAGEYELLIRAESGKASDSNKENVIIGGSSVTGLTVVSPDVGRIVSYILLIVIGLGVAVLIVRRIIVSRKRKKEKGISGLKQGFMRIKPKK